MPYSFYFDELVFTTNSLELYVTSFYVLFMDTLNDPYDTMPLATLLKPVWNTQSAWKNM